MKTAVIVALVVALFSALMLLGEKERLPDYEVLKEEFATMDDGGYDLADLDSPRLFGTPLKLLAFLFRAPVIGRILGRVLANDNKVIEVRKLAAYIPDAPLYYPFLEPKTSVAASTDKPAFSITAFRDASLSESKSTKGFKYSTIADYTSRYESGELTPLQVARALIKAADESDKAELPLRAFAERHDDDILAQAKESTARYAQGKPLGVLDGIPVIIKDEFDVKGYHTSVGTSFIGQETGIAAHDSVPVARLRAAGAIIVGKANMHEIGSGVTGYNMNFGTARNPHNPRCYSGGSSSGSAVAVASGLLPLAVGMDGGGSIRIPSGLCGVVGLKPTFQRVPPVYPDCPSVCQVGPITTNVRDAAVAMQIMSGGDATFPRSFSQPPVELGSFDNTESLKGVKVGYFPEFVNHSAPEIAAAVGKVLLRLQERGAQLVETRLDHLTAIHMAHAMTISSEMTQNIDKYFSRFSELSPEVASIMAFGRTFSAMDILASQRVRAFALRQIQDEVFSKADIFVTPTTGVTAPEIPLDALAVGEMNAKQIGQIFRFSVYGNLVGTPGITIPVDYDARGLPISVQLQANHWDEDIMLRVAHATEKLHMPVQRKPQVYFAILEAAAKEPKN
ncbi:TPA: hypothetical protein N0F65_009019 [Lagenidium giganteum]|uniref:Amidase domain-containing protein n=1 Tax=Lagenidium giganteum TaxID=4803 RepID=A0AAV2YYY9_9STRA|nr:TPA: hypothetical protein N0F65_009019 [Lagenidium giganteum]